MDHRTLFISAPLVLSRTKSRGTKVWHGLFASTRHGIHLALILLQYSHNYRPSKTDNYFLENVLQRTLLSKYGVRRYGLDNLKFGKIDVGRYPDAAKKYSISDSSTSKQLPTVILFRHGEEFTRRPVVDLKGKTMRFFFTAVSTKIMYTNSGTVVA